MRLHTSVLAAGLVLFGTTLTSAAIVENFDSYASQAEFEAVWKPWSTDGSSMIFDRSGINGSGGVHGVATVNYTVRNARNMDSFTAYKPTDANPVRFEFWLYDSNPLDPTPPNGARNTVEIRAQTGDGIPPYGTGTVQGVIAMGLYNNPVSDDNFHARVYYGGVNSWFSLNTPRTAGWHRLTSLIGDSSVKFYVDGQLDTTVPLTNPSRLFAFDGIVLGSGLTSGGYDAGFDNLSVAMVPEPLTLLSLSLGAMLLWKRRRPAAC